METGAEPLQDILRAGEEFCRAQRLHRVEVVIDPNNDDFVRDPEHLRESQIVLAETLHFAEERKDKIDVPVGVPYSRLASAGNQLSTMPYFGVQRSARVGTALFLRSPSF